MLRARLEQGRTRLPKLEDDLGSLEGRLLTQRWIKDDLVFEAGRMSLFLQQVDQGRASVDHPLVQASRDAHEKKLQYKLEQVRGKIESVPDRGAKAADVETKLALRRADIEKGSKKVAELKKDVARWEERRDAQAKLLEEMEEEIRVKQCSDQKSVALPLFCGHTRRPTVCLLDSASATWPTRSRVGRPSTPSCSPSR